MKTMRTNISLALVVVLILAGGAFAQSNRQSNRPSNRPANRTQSGGMPANNNIPGPTDYEKFSRFIAERNVFDPSRQPHFYNGSTPIIRPTNTGRPRSSAPAFALVGIMSYEKGLFAFFSGNDANYKKVLPAAETIAGYTVAEITPGRVVLESTNQQQKIEMKVGDMMRKDPSGWQHVGAGEIPAGAVVTDTAGAAVPDDSKPTVPASSAEPNEILKRLMQLREQEQK